jgi:hypothetical protein
MAGDDDLLRELGAALMPRTRTGPPAQRVAQLRTLVVASAAAGEPAPLPVRPAGPEVRTLPFTPFDVGVGAAPTPGGTAGGDGHHPTPSSAPAPLRHQGRGNRRSRWRSSLRYAAVAAVAGVTLGVAGGLIGGIEDQAPEPVLEFDGELSAAATPDESAPVDPGDRVTGRMTVTRTGIGRVIRFASDSLPVLPPGEFYEVWFVAPGDTPERPERISAGTFHPDEQGRSSVQLTAAVDPALYPAIAITAEAADGNPGPGTREVLAAELRPPR